MTIPNRSSSMKIIQTIQRTQAQLCLSNVKQGVAVCKIPKDIVSRRVFSVLWGEGAWYEFFGYKE